MWHEFFHFIDRIEHSLREHHVWWMTGIGSGLGFGILALGILWQSGTFSSTFRAFPEENMPAALVGAHARELESTTHTPHTQNESESTTPHNVRAVPTQLIALIGDSVVRVPMGGAYTDDGAALVGGTESVFDTYVNGKRVEEVVLDTSVPGEHHIEYRPRAGDAGATRTVIVE